MRLFYLFLILTTSAVWANSGSKTLPTNHSDAFHNSAFGSVGPTSLQQKEEEAPLWDIPEESQLPQVQKEENIPSTRVNEWYEQSQRAGQGDEE